MTDLQVAVIGVVATLILAAYLVLCERLRA